MIVTGPSFTSSTAILAPNTPVCTATAEAFVLRLGDLGLGRSRERGTIAFRRVRDQRELAHDERRASRVEQRSVELARLLEDAEACDLAGKTLRNSFSVAVGDAEQDEDARPYFAAGR